MTIPKNVEITLEPGCKITFLSDVKTLERSQEENLATETVSEKPITYQKDDVIEFLNETNQVKFIYETK